MHERNFQPSKLIIRKFENFFFQILGNTIYSHVLEDEYAARVSNLVMYDSVRFVQKFEIWEEIFKTRSCRTTHPIPGFGIGFRRMGTEIPSDYPTYTDSSYASITVYRSRHLIKSRLRNQSLIRTIAGRSGFISILYTSLMTDIRF